jgi:glycine cleavage system H lipoate-binding protein
MAGVGDGLTESTDKEIFKFFGVDAADPLLKEEARLVLRPETPYLSEVTQLRVRVNDQGKVERMELWMDSQFMQDEWVRAYDLATWFLGASVPEADAEDVRLFRLELEYPQDKDIYYKDMTVPTEVPKTASRAYSAFKGEVASYEQKLTGATLRIENTEIAGKKWIRMIVLDQKAPNISQLSKGSKYKI